MHLDMTNSEPVEIVESRAESRAESFMKWYFIIALRLVAYASCFFFGVGVFSYLSSFGVPPWTVVVLYGFVLYELVLFVVKRLYKPGFYLIEDPDAPPDAVSLNEQDYLFRLDMTRSIFTFVGYYTINVLAVIVLTGTPVVENWFFGLLGLPIYIFSFLGSVSLVMAAGKGNYFGKDPRIVLYTVGSVFQLPLLAYAGYALYVTFV